jgi:hypothetical protein
VKNFYHGIFILILAGSPANHSFAQGCCSGGSGSPIAGGASQGVLRERQFEIALNHQYLNTNRFLTRDKDTAELFDNLNSNYLYARIAYGVTDKFTMSVESGYFINKTQFGLERSDTAASRGIADLILFPRYCIYTHNTERVKTELTVGLGLKIPLGKYSDSMVVYRDPVTSIKYYTIAPPTVQPTNGSQDFIFYGFYYKGYSERKLSLFASAIYIRKGWNPLGQKFGDYSNLGLFVSRSIKNFNLVLQARAEYVTMMKADKNVDMLALYNVDILSTGSRKVFLAPQISFAKNGFISYIMYEMPLYQYLNGTQVGSEHQVMLGVAFRFFARS